MAQAAITTDVRWALSADNGAQGLATGTPDGQFFALGVTPTIATSNFNTNPTQYSDLHTLLGISSLVLGQAEIIAWEGNGGGAPAPFNGWESTRFGVHDSQFGFTINHDEAGVSLLPGILATGSVSSAAYESYFNLTPGSSPTTMSWILLDVPDGFLNYNAPFFYISITAGSSVGLGGEGTPDPESIGIISVPEPRDDLRARIAVSCVDICWPGRTNKTYQVQYQSELTTNAWLNLGPPVTGNGTNCITDTVDGRAHRFYRIQDAE